MGDASHNMDMAPAPVVNLFLAYPQRSPPRFRHFGYATPGRPRKSAGILDRKEYNPMTRYLSLTRTGLTVLLLVGIASALHAQTSTNSAATNSTFSPDAPKANRVLLQNSGGSPIIFPDPETILGHRLLLEMGTRNATTQRANEDYFITTGKARSLAHQRPAITHRYFVTDIGTLGGTESFAFAINDSGRVVGLSRIAGDATTHSFLYSNGRITDLYPLNSQDIQTVGPTGINNSGQIASGLVIGGVYSPAIFDSRTGITLLGSLGGVTSYGFNGVATSINNRGDAVGYSYIDSINRHAFLYSRHRLFWRL
jgi:probable HAF family extracellular repeat protein